MNHPDLTMTQRYGAAIDAIAGDMGVSGRELSDLTGIPQSTLSRTLKGQRAVNVEDLGRIANALGVPMSAIVTRAEQVAA